MTPLPSIAIVVPLLGATVAMAAAPIPLWRLRDTFGIAVAGATLVATGWLLTSQQLIVDWIGGWEPVDGLGIGIALAVDPLGAGTAALAALLGLAALAFSWRYFEAVGALYHTLMLLFVGGMVGFALTGDLFNLFVFFELLTTAAYALTAYQIERPGPLQGSLNFAVTNTIGAFLILHGIGLLYARTGALNLAEIGRELTGAQPDLVLVVSFALLSVGVFTKAAIVPFHLWLPDAHAVAPSPVSVLLSGVMIELGLYAWMRIYWTVYAPVFGPHADRLRVVVVVLGIATALVAGLFALAQHHLKRLLAYSSVSHSGLILVGIGLLGRDGLTGAALYTVAHGAIKGALFLLAGIVLHRYEDVDELALHGRGRRQPLIGVLIAVGALALAGAPPFGTTLGKQLIEEAAHLHHLGLAVTATFVLAGALTAGSVLRAAGRIFWGLGPRTSEVEELVEDEEEPETGQGRGRVPLVMLVPVFGLLAIALAVGVVPSVAATAEVGATMATDTAGYAAAVLDGAPLVGGEPDRVPGLTGPAALLGLLTAALAVAVAGLGLGAERVPSSVRRGGAWAYRVVAPVRRLQSGKVTDYVAWMTFGLGALGGIYVLVL